MGFEVVIKTGENREITIEAEWEDVAEWYGIKFESKEQRSNFEDLLSDWCDKDAIVKDEDFQQFILDKYRESIVCDWEIERL